MPYAFSFLVDCPPVDWRPRKFPGSFPTLPISLFTAGIAPIERSLFTAGIAESFPPTAGSFPAVPRNVLSPFRTRNHKHRTSTSTTRRCVRRTHATDTCHGHMPRTHATDTRTHATDTCVRRTHATDTCHGHMPRTHELGHILVSSLELLLVALFTAASPRPMAQLRSRYITLIHPTYSIDTQPTR